MTDPASTALTAPRFALGDGAAAYDAAVERARDEEWANRLFARDVRLWSSDQRVGEAIAERLGWLDAPAHFAERIAGARGVRRRGRRRGLHDRGRGRHGRQQPRPGRPRTGRSASLEGYLDAAHPRLDRPGLRVGDARRPRPARGRSSIVASKSGHDDRAERLPRRRLGARRGGARGRSRTTATSTPARYFAAITDPGKSVEAHRPPRRLPRGLPQPARHRRPLLGADLRRARPGVAHRDRPRRAARVGLGDARAPAASRIRPSNPGVSLGLAIGTLAKAGRDKLTFLADDEIASFGGVARAAHRREHRQARRRASCRSTSSRSARSRPTAPTARSSGSRSPARTAAARDDARARRSRRPAIRSSGSSSPTRSTSAPSSSAGRSRPPSPGAVLGHRPVRPAQRRGGQGADARRPRAVGTSRGRRRGRPAAEPIADGDGLTLHGDAALRLTAGEGDVVGELARHLARRRAERLPVPPGVHRPDARPRRGRSRASGRCSATGPAARRPPATARASCTRPASSTRAARRSAGSSS